jgi:hypothetical protein
VDAHIAKVLEKKPDLVQISSAWKRNGAPLGRNRYVELELRKTRTQSQTAKANPAQKPCEKMTEAIVMDGGKRGQIVKVCADSSCRTHYGNRPSPQAMQRERAEERKRIEKEKLAITIRHRILAAVLKSFAPPFKKAEVFLVVRFIVSRLQFAHVLQIAKRHRVEVDANTDAPERDLLKHVSRLEEAELCRLLLELSLLDSAYRLPGKDADDVLLGAAKRYRVDTEKIEKEVAQKLFANRKKSGPKPNAKKTLA